jgi:BirA family biotin operon repressor/biotin-[acetyl-CoA-carboxylase] ligase
MPAQEPLFQLFSFPCLGSTMDEARALAREGFTGAAIVRADTQTSGRGRIGGRTWVDAPKLSLLMTILLPADFKEAKALPLRAGLGVVRALEETAALNETVMIQRDGKPAARSYKFRLKWPNDVLVQPHPQREPGERSAAAIPRDGAAYGKLCGILCESAQGRILIGIGMNLRSPPPVRSHSGLQPASLEETWGCLPPPFDNLDEAAHYVAQQVIDTLSDPQWHSEYERRLWGRGSTLQFLAGHPQSPERMQGMCVGIDEDGALILNIEGEKKTFTSGEIASLRLV